MVLCQGAASSGWATSNLRRRRENSWISCKKYHGIHFFIRKNHVLKPVIYHSVHSFYHLSGKKRQFRTACSGSWTSGKSCTAQRPERFLKRRALLGWQGKQWTGIVSWCVVFFVLCFVSSEKNPSPKWIPTIDSPNMLKVDSKNSLPWPLWHFMKRLDIAWYCDMALAIFPWMSLNCTQEPSDNWNVESSDAPHSFSREVVSSKYFCVWGLFEWCFWAKETSPFARHLSQYLWWTEFPWLPMVF